MRHNDDTLDFLDEYKRRNNIEVTKKWITMDPKEEVYKNFPFKRTIDLNQIGKIISSCSQSVQDSIKILFDRISEMEYHAESIITGKNLNSVETSKKKTEEITTDIKNQLDGLSETLLRNLFLFHLSVEVAKKNGESLNSKIDTIRKVLQDNISAQNLFNNKLLEAGYFDRHKYLYEEKCYQIRNENYYKIDGDFPRIKEQEIRNGIGDIKYSIILSQCMDYLISENTVFDKISIL